MNSQKILFFISLTIMSFSISVHSLQKETTIGDVLKSLTQKSPTRKEDIKKHQTALPSDEIKEKKKPVEEVNQLSRVKPPKSVFLNEEGSESEIEYEKTVDEAIKELYQLVKKFKKSSNRDKLWLRLAEQYVEKAKIVEARLQREYDKKLEDFQEGRTKSRPHLSLDGTRIYYLKAIELYDWYMKDFPKGALMPQALYFLGYTHYEMGNVKKGTQYYEKLIQEYPNSHFVGETNFALGEHHFDREKWVEAYPYYEKVIKLKNERLYQLALYKLAWTAHKLRKTDLALKNLEGVIRYSGISSEQRSVRKIRLISEASKDLVSFYGETKQYENAENYFSQLVGEKRSQKMIEQLAYYYVDAGHREGALYLFKHLITKDPFNERAFDFQKQIVLLFSASGKSQVFLDELNNWVNNYNSKSEWAKVNNNNKQLVESSLLILETDFRKYILEFHRSAQNSKLEAVQKRTHIEYSLYISTFPESKKMDEMRFFHGELLYDMKKYQAAADEYLWIVNNSSKSNYNEKSMLNAILSLEQLLPTDIELKKLRGDSKKTIALDSNMEHFEEIVEKYINKYQSSPKAPEIRFRLGLLYYNTNHFEKAIKTFNDVIEKHPNSKQSVVSANLILDIHNSRNDYSALEESGRKFLSIPSINQGDSGKHIRDIVEKAGFKKAQVLEENKNYAESASAFEAFSKHNLDSQLKMGAQFNAGVNYERSGQLLKSIEMYRGILISSKDKKILKKSRQLLAGLYQKTGQYSKAAEQFEIYVKEDPKEALSKEMTFNAAVIWEGLLNYPQALKNYKLYIEMVGRGDSQIAQLNVAEIYFKQKDYKNSIEYFKKYLSGPTKDIEKIVEVHFKIAQIEKTLGSDREAERWYKETIQVQKRLSRSVSGSGAKYAAEAKLKLTYPLFEELRRIKFPSDTKMQKNVLDRKLGMINELNRHFGEVINYNSGEHIVAALTIIGQGYSNMYHSLIEAPPPENLGEKDLEKYKTAIESLAQPFKLKAVENLKAAIDKAYAIEVYPKWLSVAKETLKKYESPKNADIGERVDLIEAIDWMEL